MCQLDSLFVCSLGGDIIIKKSGDSTVPMSGLLGRSLINASYCLYCR